MATYTCITCHIAFNDPNLQRSHYKTDWHRYNLKRKVVGMPPVTAATFQEKVKEHRAAATSENEGISGFYCKLCQKRFNTHNTFENHKKSKKHRDLETKHLGEVAFKVVSQDIISDKTGESLSEEKSNVVEKAVADAKADFDQPKVLRVADQKPAQEFVSGDNPRMRWFKKQAKALQEDDDMWEDLDDDDDEEVEDMEDEQPTKDEDADMESLASEGGERAKQRQIATSECLFCLKKSADVEKNVVHMSTNHGFFIPDIEYLADLEGLLLYLGEKVGIGNVCMWCNEKGKAFYSISAVLKHMRDKGHCNMLVTGDAALEYADFYDFGEDEEMEDDEDLDEEDVPTGESQDLELVLPSGASIGHRSLLRYYKQNFPTVDRTAVSKRHKALGRLISQYKAIGWHGSSGQVSRMQKDLAYVQSMKAKYRLKLSSKNNKTQMKHFRCQVIF